MIPSPLALISFGGFWTLFNEVLAKAPDTSIDNLREAAYAIDLPKGSLLTGAGVALKPLGDAEQGQNAEALISVMQWQDGSLNTVWPAEVANVEPIMVPLPAWTER